MRVLEMKEAPARDADQGAVLAAALGMIVTPPRMSLRRLSFGRARGDKVAGQATRSGDFGGTEWTSYLSGCRRLNGRWRAAWRSNTHQVRWRRFWTRIFPPPKIVDLLSRRLTSLISSGLSARPLRFIGEGLGRRQRSGERYQPGGEMACGGWREQNGPAAKDWIALCGRPDGNDDIPVMDLRFGHRRVVRDGRDARGHPGAVGGVRLFDALAFADRGHQAAPRSSTDSRRLAAASASSSSVAKPFAANDAQ